MMQPLRRKGQSAESIPWYIRIMMMIAAMIVIAMLVRTYTDRTVDSRQLDRGVYLYRIYYSDIVMYSDPITKRIYPGIVDYNKLAPDVLDKVFVVPDDRPEPLLSSQIIFTPATGCALQQKTIYNNQATFNNHASFGNTLQGVGGQTADVINFPITIKQGPVECPGNMSITIVRLNS